MNAGSKNQYDYIIAGAGCAGLSLALELQKSKLLFKRVLLIDADAKKANDRTWCYWSTAENDAYAHLHACSWQQIKFIAPNFEQISELDKYSYNLIRGADFYIHALNKLKNDTRFEFVIDSIEAITSKENFAEVKTVNGVFTAKLAFNSIFRNFAITAKHNNLVQHFKGWKISCQEEMFVKQTPTFMDFSVEQFNDCRFFYVLPFSTTEALVEYTGFSKESISDEAYDIELKKYIGTLLKGKAYTITETEKGSIPMYESAAINTFGKSVIAIGTAGGASKASTGYTFYFIQKHVKELVSLLEQGKQLPPVYRRNKRFLYYDRILLYLLHSGTLSGQKIFSTMFNRNSRITILEFLNEESTLLAELRMFTTLPVLPFAKAAIKKLFK